MIKIINSKLNIPVFLSSDNNYAPFVATTIASICNNTKSFCDFYILDSGISEECKEKICDLKNLFSNFSIEFIKIDLEKEFKDIEYKNDCKYVSLSTYNRFLIPKLKPNIDKAIYLDVDVIALGDINELYQADLSDFALGAIADQGDEKLLQQNKDKIKLKPESVYFNAGVLLIDSNKWRNNNIFEKLISTEKKYRELLSMADQDVLNIYFESNYKELKKKYNVIYDNQEIIIRHFAGFPKPWQADFYLNSSTKKPRKIENSQEFWKYAQMTLFYKDFLLMKETFLNSNILYKRFNKLVKGDNI